MKKIAPFLLAILLCGCVHDHPDDESVDPTLVEITADVTLDLALLPLETTANVQSTKAPAGYLRRFIVEAWREGRAQERQVTVTEETAADELSLPVSLKLHAVEYTLVVWTDYVKADAPDSDLYYDTQDLQHIVCTEPYTGSTPYRDCLSGTAALDLRAYRDMWNARVAVQVEMVRPLAKYELIATDVEKFLDKTQRQRADGESYTVTVAYGYYLPLGYDALSGKPHSAQTGVAFSAPLQVADNGSGECVIASDFFFVNGEESFMPLSIEIHDSEGGGISRTSGIDVTYRRGHLTTVRWHFLTNRFDPGIGIDPEFDDEDIDIDIDDLTTTTSITN